MYIKPFVLTQKSSHRNHKIMSVMPQSCYTITEALIVHRYKTWNNHKVALMSLSLRVVNWTPASVHLATKKTLYLLRLWALPNNSKLSEVSFSPILTYSLCLWSAQMSRSGDFGGHNVQTTDKTDCFTTCVCMRGNKGNQRYRVEEKPKDLASRKKVE